MLKRLREILNSKPRGENVNLAGIHVSSDAVSGGNQPFELGDFAIDEYRPMKIIAIGAGMSGILAGIRFREHIANLDLTIYEKEDHIGGTWYVNRYPGIACDVPSHCYQYTFERKSDWSALYPPGSEILASLDQIVAKYKLEPYIKLRHELVHAQYIEETGRWSVRIRRSSTSPSNTKYEEIDDEADFLFMGIGLLHRWSWPDIEGLKDFKGTLVHSADWRLGGATWQDDVKDWGDKDVAVIGLGSSSLQIVSALQDKVGKLTQYARGRAWVCPPVLIDRIAEILGHEVDEDNLLFTEEDRKLLNEDPERAWNLRITLENYMNSSHAYTILGSPLQKECQDAFKTYMLAKLASKPEIAEQLIPNFSVAARRLTPAPGYLKALTRENVNYVTTSIKRMTASGIETADGVSSNHDIIICATGYDVSFRLPFPMIGRKGVDLRDKWTPYPSTYLSVCTDGFPNCFFSAGPNTGTGGGSFLIMLEQQVEYAVRAAEKMQRERLKSIEVKVEAVRDFDEYIESYFPKTVFSEKVRSWYKMGKEEGRVVGVWPGSNTHHIRALKHPRWEDYNYESHGKTNRFWWFGNGYTWNEQTLSGDRAWYLNEDYVDVPTVPA